MIQHSFSSGKIIITDASFGHVGVGDPLFSERLRTAIGWEPSSIAWMDQIHSPTVELVGALDGSAMTFAKTDGLITKQSEILLVTKTADCVPILLWNERENIIAALHCGWRGFLAGIIDSFFQLCKGQGFESTQFSAFLGPHLRVESFEVQEDFLAQLAPAYKHLLIQQDGKIFFDITRGVVEQLEAGGIRSIEDCGIDTFLAPEYFSYRRWHQLPEHERPKSYNTFASCIIMR